MTWDSVRVPMHQCPHCDARLDAAMTMLTDQGVPEQPEPGDITICVMCAVVLKFCKGGYCTIMTLDELRTYANDDPPQVAALGKAWFAVQRVHSRKVTTIN
jgi:hypothetical protein